MPVDLKGVFGKMWEMADAYKANVGHTIQKDGMAWLMNQKTWDSFCESSDSVPGGYLESGGKRMLGCYVITSSDVPGKEVFLVVGSSNKWLQHPSSHPKTPKPKWKPPNIAGLAANTVSFDEAYGVSSGSGYTFGPSNYTFGGAYVATWNAGPTSTDDYYVCDSTGQTKFAYASMDLSQAKAQEIGGFVKTVLHGVTVWKSPNWALIVLLGGPSAIKMGTHIVVHGGKSYQTYKSPLDGQISVSESHPGGVPFDPNNVPKWWKLNAAGTIETVAYATGTVESAPSTLLLDLKAKMSDKAPGSMIIELNGHKYKVWKMSDGAIEAKLFGKALLTPSVGPAKNFPHGHVAVNHPASTTTVYSDGQLDNVLSTFKTVHHHSDNPLLDKSLFTLKAQEAAVSEVPSKITSDDLYDAVTKTYVDGQVFVPSFVMTDEQKEYLKEQLKEMPVTTIENKDNNG